MKHLVVLFVMTFSAGVFATGENKVYIEQQGNANTITIDQIGSTNNIGGVTLDTAIVYGIDNIITTFTPSAPSSNNYALINGSTNTITLNHKGDNNWSQYSIFGNNNRYTNTSIGNNNKFKTIIGATGSSGTPAVTNSKNDNTISETVTGDLNYLIQTLTKASINSSTTVTGNSNQITTRLNSNSGDVTTSITGSNNSLINEQDDGGTGHQLVQSITGGYNSIVTQQQGTNDSTINILTNGDHNTITVRSTNAISIVDSKTAVVR